MEALLDRCFTNLYNTVLFRVFPRAFCFPVLIACAFSISNWAWPAPLALVVGTVFFLVMSQQKLAEIFSRSRRGSRKRLVWAFSVALLLAALVWLNLGFVVAGLLFHLVFHLVGVPLVFWGPVGTLSMPREWLAVVLKGKVGYLLLGTSGVTLASGLWAFGANVTGWAVLLVLAVACFATGMRLIILRRGTR